MLNRLLVVILCLAALVTHVGMAQADMAQTKPLALPAGVQLVAESLEAKDPAKPFIPWRKYQLANGLTVLLHQDDSDPLVHVQVDYHVGSSRERLGYSGFAHFFEHMMFQGSENVATGQHFKIVDTAGGTLNGATDRDRTVYYQTVPANQLETVLWLEADRMGFLLPAVTQEKFEIQRDTVKNERAQRIDNQPYGRVGEVLAEMLYPLEHPYSWPVIGYPADLNRATLQDLRQFFLRWYGPNNALLTIAGQIDPEQTLAWIAKYFGAIPPGPEVPALEKTQVTLDESRHRILEDRIAQPLVQIQWPTVWWDHPDQAALSLLASMLGQGRGSVIQANLVESEKLLGAGASHRCGELSCAFGLYAIQAADETKPLANAEQLVRAELAGFMAAVADPKQQDALQERLAREKQQRRAGVVFGLQSAAGKAGILAWHQLYKGDPGNLAHDMARYEAVTLEDINRVAQAYLQDKPSVMLSVVPRGKVSLAASEVDWQIPQRRVEEREAPLPVRVPQNDQTERTRQPQALPNPPLVPPKYWQKEQPNGMTVVGSYYDEAPTVTFSINLRAGSRFVPVEKAGLASLTAAMLEEGTQSMDAVSLAQALEGLGSNISFSAGLYHTSVSLSSLTDKLPQTLDILRQMLFEPRFAEADFNRLKSQWLQGLKQQLLRPSSVARQQWGWLNYGPDNPLGWPTDGTLETISALTLDDVKAFYRQYYSPAGSRLVLVGMIEQQPFMAQIPFLTDWQGELNAWPEIPKRPEPKDILYLVDRPGAVQSVLRVGRPGLPFDATGDHFRNQLVNYALGGNFNSRLNMALREELGYTYGVRSYFSGGPESGSFLISTDVRRDVTTEALMAMLAILDKYREQGPTADELSQLRQAITQQEALQYETPGQKAGYLHKMLMYDLAPGFTRQQAELIQSISREELLKQGQQWLPAPGGRLILVVGDKEKILPGLGALKLEIVELDTEKQSTEKQKLDE